MALKESLDVDRKDGANELTWDPQTGVDGYQIWSSDSPFVLLTTLRGQSASSYTDTEGDKSTKYLVTASLGTDELTADEVNAGDVPGYDEAPKGESAGSGGKGFIPAPGLMLVAIALAGALLVARRRL